MSIVRKLIAIPAAGLAWYFGLRLFFVWSGAQSILGDPARQSKKFFNAFVQEPFPRMAANTWLPLQGMLLCGVIASLVFIFLNKKLNGGWLKKGFQFGIIAWALMVPWFEFYLPYNVMLEPLPLVLFECLLWLGVMLLMGLVVSFILNI